MTTRPFSPTLKARPRRSAALGAWHVKAGELKGSPGIGSLESGSGRTVVSCRSAGSEEGAEDQRLGKETTMSKWTGMTIAPAARSLEGRPLGMRCSVMLSGPSRLRLLELGSSFVTALGEQRQEVKSDRNAAAPLRRTARR